MYICNHVHDFSVDIGLFKSAYLHIFPRNDSHKANHCLLSPDIDIVFVLHQVKQGSFLLIRERPCGLCLHGML